jgi:hypothetical protein
MSDVLGAAFKQALLWLVCLAAVSGLIAAATLLTIGLVIGQTSPMWFRLVHLCRTAGAVLGSILVVGGLLHYRDTEPQGEIQWLVFGLVILVGVGLVHFWLTLISRKDRRLP